MSDFAAKTLCILGRQPQFGLAELEAVYGADHVQPLGTTALLDIDAEKIKFKNLGGTLKVARLLTVLPNDSWESAYDYLRKEIPKHVKKIPEGKFTLGASVYGMALNLAKLQADLLSLKKEIQATGRSVRIVPNTKLELNAAQVLHNGLVKKGGWELLLVRHEGQFYLAQTLFVQDIDAYAARDQARPARDARVGMLPPKLAQIMVNLAVGESDRDKSRPVRLLDPFCGTGVILQEALLMGYSVYGTDIDPRMVEYSEKNLRWLFDKYPALEGHAAVEAADATNYNWPGFNVLASELYLGRPLAKLPAQNELERIIQDVNTITKKFLQNLLPQLRENTQLCLAVPAWRRPDGSFIHLPLLDAFDSAKPRSASTLSVRPIGRKVERVDQLTDMGYNYLDLKTVPRSRLLYYRENQIVARQFIRLKKSN